MKQPRDRRWARHLTVRFWRRGDDENVYRGLTSDLSKSGVFIRTRDLQQPGTRLTLRLGSDEESFVIEGVVARALRSPAALQSVRPTGMGVRFLTVDELVDEILPAVADTSTDSTDESPPRTAEADEESPDDGDSLAGAEGPSAADSRRSGEGTAEAVDDDDDPPFLRGRDPRAGAGEREVFRVILRDRDQFRTVFERDIQTGGLFVPADDPAPMDSTVWVEVTIEEIDREPVQVEARVVHRFDRSAASEATGPAGMGVQFTDLDRAVPRLRALLDD